MTSYYKIYFVPSPEFDEIDIFNSRPNLLFFLEESLFNRLLSEEHLSEFQNKKNKIMSI